MKLTKKLLSELQNRLKVGNRRGVHLNAIPGRSRYKFDLHRLAHLNEKLPQDFVNSLLSNKTLKFRISWEGNVNNFNSLFEDDQAQLVKITKSFENLINQTDAIEAEKGINTFGFGFPLFIRRDQSDNKLTVAPILIWSLRIKRTKEFNTWIVHRNQENPVYLNEVLINHLQSDSKVTIDQISPEMLEDGLIDREKLLDICVDLLKATNPGAPTDVRDNFDMDLNAVRKIGDKKYFEQLLPGYNNSFIEFAGLFSIFEVQKQNIINDYDELMNLEGMSLDLEDLDKHSFQSLSSVETDPSQQGILNSLETKRNILIQGPPGTGKSQSLTAVLINALENHKKTIVVCEKKTALEVLEKALNKRGLRNNFVLIKDVVRDRKIVVNSVRDRIHRSSYRRYRYTYSKESLNIIISRCKSLIESINRKHLKIGKNVIADNSWTDIVGWLLAELKSNEEDYKLNFDNSNFEFNSKELDHLLQIAQKAQRFYKEYFPHQEMSFLNPKKLVGDNPFELEQQIKEIIKNYTEEFQGKDSAIIEIRKRNNDNPDLFDLEKTKSIGYQIAAWFSRSKKNTLHDQQELYELCFDLAESINNDDWYQYKIDKVTSESIISDIQGLIKSSQEYFNHKNDLFFTEYKWFGFYNSLSDSERILVDSLKEKTNWKKVLLIYYLDSLLMNLASNDLPIDDVEHNELNGSLSQIGKEQMRYIQQYWFSRQIDLTRDFEYHNDGLTVENLYNKRSSHLHKRHSLRQIVKFDPELFTTFFPIILTTPDVCSNLFKGLNKYFDIVLFDEASQLRVEDNLTALLKGKQIVIAGDEHQMPPSNYFSKIYDGTIEDEDDLDEEDESEENYIDRDDLLLSCESLLEFAEELSFEKRFLDFHYRSKHPFLIDFSNHAFYNKRLKPLPNNFDYTPIKYIQVNGTYSDHSNDQEAEAVISILEHNIHRLPNGNYPSVGIATFNIAQRNLILGKIRERKRLEKFAEFNEKIIELENSGFFVKNLENIQGDERDVIILSTTYGINKDGKFYQRFGPINHKKGYKLLNVIITRAKYKIYVCSSIPEEVFLNYKDYLATEGANNRRAALFAYLAYAKAVSENDKELKQSVLKNLLENSEKSTKIDAHNEHLESPFEEEVFHALSEHFDGNKLIPQFEFAGFRIDIVYDPKVDGLPKIAIECDGAKYHSSQEAYLYDHHRQKILESHGFVFHRIWSTNWWRNPKRETKKLVDFIKYIESQNPTNSATQSNYDNAFTDDISKIRISSKPILTELDKTTKETIQTIKHAEEKPTRKVAKVVGINSKVKVRYLNNGKDLTVQLTEKASSIKKSSNQIQKINIKSQLAASIFGKSIGETVKVGDLDNFVEILEIEN